MVSNSEGGAGAKSWRHLHKARLVRVVIDLMLVNASLMLATGIACLIEVASRRELENVAGLMEAYRNSFLVSAWLLTLVTLPVFAAFGFYSRGAKYLGRNKVAIILAAVGTSHGLVWAVTAAAPGIFQAFAAPVLASAAISGSLLVASRLWSQFWRNVAFDEWRAQETPAPAGRPKNVLVIGGAGYVGSSLLKMLLAKGYNVRLLDLFMYGDEPVKDVLGHKNLEVIRGDFRHLDVLVQAVYGMDAVIHLGAIVGDPACSLNEEFTLEVNLTATRMVAELAKACGIQRFIFASTCSVYGASDDYLNEDSALNPVSLYARSKIASERVLNMMADHRFQPTILRFGTIYGLSGRTRFDLVVNLLTAKAIKEGVITVFGADQWRPFVHVEDAALSVLMVLEAPLSKVGKQVFNVGSDAQNRTLGQVGEMINKLVPTAKLVVSGTDGDRRNYRVDFSRITREIGFTPRWTLESGIQQVVDAFKSGKVTDYGDARYSNVKFLMDGQGQRLIRTESEWLRSLVEDIQVEDETVISIASAK